MVRSTVVHKCGPGCLRKHKCGQQQCDKYFPKAAQPVPTINERGLCLHQRDGRPAMLAAFYMRLLKRYYCHINVEVASCANIMAYLYKYVFKGPDKCNVTIRSDGGGAAMALSSALYKGPMGFGCEPAIKVRCG